MTKSFLIIHLILFSIILNAQNRSIDSLKASLKLLKEDTNKVNTLLDLENQYVFLNDYKNATKIANEAMACAVKINYKKSIAKVYYEFANLSFYQGDWEKAIKLFTNSLKKFEEIDYKNGIGQSLFALSKLYSLNASYDQAIIYSQRSLKAFEEINNKKEMAHSLSIIGHMYFLKGNYTKSLENHYKALKICENIGAKVEIANTLCFIGNVYSVQQNFNKSIESYNIALKIYKEEVNNKYNVAIVLGNLAGNYMYIGEYTKAYDYYNSSLKTCEELKDKNGIATSLSNIGGYYIATGDSIKSLENFQKALKIRESINDKEGIIDCLINIGGNYLLFHKKKETLDCWTKALNYAREIGSLENIKSLEENLSEFYEESGNNKDALMHYKAYEKIKDSLTNNNNTEKQVRLEMNYEFDKQQTADSLKIVEERKINEVKFKQEKTQRFALYGGLALVIIFAGFMFNRVKITQKQKYIIQTQKHLVDEKHKEITDSINYAERIQRSLLASNELLSQNLMGHFVFFQPKDVVSGDFYWASKLSNNNFVLITADSTGHGVPGAIMSILNISCIEKAIEAEKLIEPSAILNHTRTKIIETLKKDGSVDGGKDGMDCSLISFDFKNNNMTYAAANNPIWLIRQGNILEFAPDKMPVGKHDRDNVLFSQHTIDLQKGDMVYTITDGMPDQFGGPKGKKFMNKQLKEFLISISDLPMSEQKEKLSNVLKNWKGDLEQVDDITILGIRI
jgi:serine phosphatase RsbU (regulator of sigma subunit)/tetratricopeptide (TPR) repeat protein